MAFSINRVTLVGNVSQDPELTYTPKGTALLKFSLATNHSTRNDDGTWTDVPSFHRIVVWNKLAEFLGNNLNKGDLCFIDGRIQYGSYEASDGTKRYTVDIVAQNVIPMRDRKNFDKAVGKETKASPKPTKPTKKKSAKKAAPATEEVNLDDIPF